MNNYKISILILFMLSVVFISCSHSDDETDEDNNPMTIDDEEGEADDDIDYEEGEAAGDDSDYEVGEEDDEDYNEEGEEDDELDDEEIGEDHNTIIIDDDEEEENENEQYDKEDEEDDEVMVDYDDKVMVDNAQCSTPKKKRRGTGGYPPHVVFSEEVQMCCIEIRNYFPKATMRENVTYAMENYVQEVNLPLHAKNYYKRMANNLLRGDIPLVGVFCKQKAEEILEPKKTKLSKKRLNKLRLKHSAKCKKLLTSKFVGPAKPLLRNAINVITTAHVEEIDNVFLTDFWDLVIHRFGLRTEGKGSMKSPAAYCIFVYQRRRKKSYIGSVSSDADDI